MTSSGREVLTDVYAKLDWAESRRSEMLARFDEFARNDGGDERPYGLKFDHRSRGGIVVVTFIAEHALPIEIALLAADLVHNARVALDHVLARLKDVFGGTPGSGYFPVAVSEEKWDDALTRTKPLKGLDQVARDLVYAEQPLHRADPAADPLTILHGLDNADKHELLHAAFAYTAAADGLGMIDIIKPGVVRQRTSLWQQGQPLEHGTPVARLLVHDTFRRDALRAAGHDFGFAVGKLGEPRTSHFEMIERVRGIADNAAQLIDDKGVVGRRPDRESH